MPKTLIQRLSRLSFEELEAWAGSKILQRARTYEDRVRGLHRTTAGTLIARVEGTDQYFTRVLLRGNHLEHDCTCPYDWGGPCKHAVAVILAAAKMLKAGKAIPVLETEGDLYQMLMDGSKEYSTHPAADVPTPSLEEILRDMEHEDLITLLLDIADRHPDVRREIVEREHLDRGRVDVLTKSLREEIRALTAEPAWYDPWNDRGELPDYSHLERQLRALADQGHADALLELGAELWSRGIDQVEQSDDEGTTADAIAGCLEIVVEALPQSSLSPSEQLLWLIDRLLKDEYGLLTNAEQLLRRRQYTRTHWREVAQVLEQRLEAMKMPKDHGFSATYERNNLLNQVLEAYARSGQKARIVPLLEREADVCRCYDRLVTELLARKESQRARHWCIRGYERTLSSAPGIAHALRDRLRDLAQRERRYPLVAAYRAQKFLETPSRETYQALRKAAEKAGCWPPVREAVIDYLETGAIPDTANTDGKPPWPLPQPEVGSLEMNKVAQHRRFPDLETLIDIAILEKRLDDVASLYQRLRTSRHSNRATNERVADALAQSRPEIALDIWRDIAENLIARVKPKAYVEAAIYLKKMKRLYANNRQTDEWNRFLQELRRRHKAKRRLMEVLDTLSGRKLVD